MNRVALRLSAAPALLLCLTGCGIFHHGPAAPNLAEGPPISGASVLNVADAAIAGNDPAMALQVSQSVLATDPSNLDALYHEAEAYYAVNRCMDAIAAYKLALKLNTRSSPAQTGIGRCLLKHNPAGAESAFAAAVADDPGNAAALNDLGIARDLQGKYAAAEQPYNQALLINPGAAATEVNLGLSEALAGDAQDALDYLGPLAAGQGATPKIREDYAAALVAASRVNDAREVLRIDLTPDQVNAMLTGFAAIIGSSAPIAQAAAAPAIAPTQSSAAVTPVMVSALGDH
jgi:Flp pilus assembly protein TadD